MQPWSLLSSSRFQILILLALLCVVNGYLLYSHGIKVVADTERYLEYANNLRSGFYFDPHNFWYIGYSLFILILGGNTTAVICVQIVLSFAAALSLYYTAVLIWKSNTSGFIAALLFVAFIDITSWNTYVLAESLFVSFTCFSLLILARLMSGTRPTWLIVLAVFVIAFTFFIKPTGIAMLVACIAVIAWNGIRSMQNKLVRVTVVLIAFCVVVLLANRMLRTYLIIDNYKSGEVVYGVTIVDPQQYSVNGLIVTPPDHLYVPSDDTPPVLKIIEVAFHHPVYWSQLFLTKAFYLLVHIRPFWSMGHNVFSVLVLLPVYFFCVGGLIRNKLQTVFIFAITFLLVHILAVCLTSEDWDGRFLMPLLPVVFLLAGSSIIKRQDVHT